MRERLSMVSEKQVEAAGDRLMTTLGFTVIRFSQARATMQTPGISDRLYINPARELAVWWEAKSSKGKQSPAQRSFQLLIESVGWAYVVGTDDALIGYLESRTLLKRLPTGALLVCPSNATPTRK